MIIWTDNKQDKAHFVRDYIIGLNEFPLLLSFLGS